MKIAIPTQSGCIAQQLGKCSTFTLIELPSGARETVTLPENGHIAVVSMLADRHAEVLICGELGLMARSALQMLEIMIVPGCTGDIDCAVEKYVRGEPQGDPAILAAEIPVDENDPLQCMHDCAKCSGCGDIPEGLQIPNRI